MPRQMLTTPYPTTEETARLLGISAKERDEIVARVAVKAEAARKLLREAQRSKPGYGLAVLTRRTSGKTPARTQTDPGAGAVRRLVAEPPKPQGGLGVAAPRKKKAAGRRAGVAVRPKPTR